MSENKTFDKKAFFIGAIVFAINYLFLYLMSATKVFNDLNAYWTNHLFIICFFFFGYFVFYYLQKEIDFKFSEMYIGVILLIMLYLAFYLAYWIYYSQVSGVFSYLIASPYIHIAISFFAGWLAFFFINFKSK